MTIDELRAQAEKAKAWRPVSACVNAVLEVGSFRCSEGKNIYDAEDDDGTFCSVPVPLSEWCPACLGAQRAVEDIAEHVDTAVEFANKRNRGDTYHAHAVNHAVSAAIIASYFCSEPNPVSEFRDAVKEAVK